MDDAARRRAGAHAAGGARLMDGLIAWVAEALVPIGRRAS